MSKLRGEQQLSHDVQTDRHSEMQNDPDLARLIWTTVLLRRMRSAALRAVKTEELAPLETVVASRRLRRGTR